MKGKLTVVHEVVEKEGGKIEEWIKDEIETIGDVLNKL